MNYIALYIGNVDSFNTVLRGVVVWKLNLDYNSPRMKGYEILFEKEKKSKYLTHEHFRIHACVLPVYNHNVMQIVC